MTSTSTASAYSTDLVLAAGGRAGRRSAASRPRESGARSPCRPRPIRRSTEGPTTVHTCLPSANQRTFCDLVDDGGRLEGEREPDRSHQVGAVGRRRDPDRRRLALRRTRRSPPRSVETIVNSRVREVRITSSARAPAGRRRSAPRRSRRTDHRSNRVRRTRPTASRRNIPGRAASIASCIAKAATSRISSAGQAPRRQRLRRPQHDVGELGRQLPRGRTPGVFLPRRAAGDRRRQKHPSSASAAAPHPGAGVPPPSRNSSSSVNASGTRAASRASSQRRPDTPPFAQRRVVGDRVERLRDARRAPRPVRVRAPAPRPRRRAPRRRSPVGRSARRSARASGGPSCSSLTPPACPSDRAGAGRSARARGRVSAAIRRGATRRRRRSRSPARHATGPSASVARRAAEAMPPPHRAARRGRRIRFAERRRVDERRQAVGERRQVPRALPPRAPRRAAARAGPF